MFSKPQLGFCLVGDGCSDCVGVGAGRYQLAGRDAAIHGQILSRAATGAGHRIGADGVAPIGGHPSIRIQIVIE